MTIFAFTQISGGVGATTEIANLTSMWPNPNRIMVELGATGGDVARIMGFNTPASPSPTGILDDGRDFGQEDPRPLSEITNDKWELPVLPAPVMPDFPSLGEQIWWQKRVDLILQSHMDVIVDMGRIAPEHLGIHNRVLNAASVVVVVVRSIDDARAAASRLALYQERLALVMINKLRSLPDEITEATGIHCISVAPWDYAIEDNTWRNLLVTKAKAKPVKAYLQAASDLVTFLGGK